MPDMPNESVAHGDRREEVRFEDDPKMVAKVRHTFKVDPARQEQSEADGEAVEPGVTDAEVVANSPSAWEARED